MYIKTILCAATLLFMSEVAVVHAAEHADGGSVVGPIFPVGATLQMSSIPDAVLRVRLHTLPEALRMRAMQQMQERGIGGVDLVDLRIDQDGNIFFVCAEIPEDLKPELYASEIVASTAAMINPVAAALASSWDSDFHPSGSVPIAKPPIFNSKPGSANVAYLDFNGDVLVDTTWNHYDMPRIVAAPYNISNSSTATFDEHEQRLIYEIWRRIAEDYAPYNINITTDPYYDDKSHIGLTVGHLLITNNGSFKEKGVGGIAALHTFGTLVNPNSPALIFYNTLGAGSGTNIAEAASHEFGHNLGLTHDGQTGNVEYYRGHGGGKTNWAPIMGTSYGKQVTQFSNGEYYHANNKQTDDTILVAQLGYRSDDHGDSRSSADALVISDNVIMSSNPANRGIIGNVDDRDVFKFSTGAGDISLLVKPLNVGNGPRGGNVDVKLRLLNSAGQQIAIADPTDETIAEIKSRVAAGTYYLEVSGTGFGNPLQKYPTGYVARFSQGQYFISGSIAGTSNPPSNKAPSINSIVVSPSGTIYAPANLGITAALSDSDGSVATATLTINGKATHEEGGAPWNWGTDHPVQVDNPLLNLAAGTYTIKVTAVDNDGASTSKTQTVTVVKKDTPPPQPSGSLKVSVAGSQQSIAAANIQSYSGTQDKGKASIVSSGNGLRLQGNAWKSASLNYTITKNTRITFNTNINDAGEITGIGFDNNNEHTDSLFGSASMFILAGTQTPDNMINGRKYAGNSVDIPVGQYYTGKINRLCFMGDDDANASTDATFSNIRIYEQNSPPPTDKLQVTIGGQQKQFAAGDIHGYSGSQDRGTGSIVNNGSGLRLQANTWKFIGLNYQVTANTMIAFDLNVNDAGEITGIGFDNDNDFTNDLYGSSNIFQLAGSQGSAANMVGGRQFVSNNSVVIPVGNYYTGAINRLCFVGDDDANASTDATFRNIRIYEKNAPPEQDMVSNLSVSSGKSYQWFAAKVNEKSYIDRDYKITSLPSALQNATALRTANDDKQSNASQKLVSFKVNKDAAVYIIYDNTSTTLENKWCNDAGAWAKQSISLQTSLGDTRVVRRKFFKAGSTVALNGNGGTSNGCSNYYVMIVPGTN